MTVNDSEMSVRWKRQAWSIPELSVLRLNSDRYPLILMLGHSTGIITMLVNSGDATGCTTWDQWRTVCRAVRAAAFPLGAPSIFYTLTVYTHCRCFAQRNIWNLADNEVSRVNFLAPWRKSRCWLVLNALLLLLLLVQVVQVISKYVVGEGGVRGGQPCGDAVCCVGHWFTNVTELGARPEP